MKRMRLEVEDANDGAHYELLLTSNTPRALWSGEAQALMSKILERSDFKLLSVKQVEELTVEVMNCAPMARQGF